MIVAASNSFSSKIVLNIAPQISPAFLSQLGGEKSLGVLLKVKLSLFLQNCPSFSSDHLWAPASMPVLRKSIITTWCCPNMSHRGNGVSMCSLFLPHSVLHLGQRVTHLASLTRAPSSTYSIWIDLNILEVTEDLHTVKKLKMSLIYGRIPAAVVAYANYGNTLFEGFCMWLTKHRHKHEHEGVLVHLHDCCHEDVRRLLSNYIMKM